MVTAEQRWVAPDLRGRVAVVTGASRGLGRGIALALGECGATVYVTGRSVRGSPTTHDRPETIDETAELVAARGGVGVPVRVDHTIDEQVSVLFERARQEHGHLDLLVNNAWGGYEELPGYEYEAPFWQQPVRRWDAMFDTGPRAHFTASRLAVPLMLPRRRGLLVSTGYAAWDARPADHIVMAAKLATNAFVALAAHQLRPHGIAAVGIAPVWQRPRRTRSNHVWGGEELRAVEAALRASGTTADLFRERPNLALGESPEYLGRAVAMLAADPGVIDHSGRFFGVDELALLYHFTDIDGRLPGAPRQS